MDDMDGFFTIEVVVVLIFYENGGGGVLSHLEFLKFFLT